MPLPLERENTSNPWKKEFDISNSVRPQIRLSKAMDFYKTFKELWSDPNFGLSIYLMLHENSDNLYFQMLDL